MGPALPNATYKSPSSFLLILEKILLSGDVWKCWQMDGWMTESLAHSWAFSSCELNLKLTVIFSLKLTYDEPQVSIIDFRCSVVSNRSSMEYNRFKTFIGYINVHRPRWNVTECENLSCSALLAMLNSGTEKYYKFGHFNQWVSDPTIYGPRWEKTCLRGLRVTKAQNSLHIRAVWSAPLLFPYWKVSYI